MAHAEPKRPPFASVNVSAPRPPERPVKPASAKPTKPPTAAEVAFASRRAACEQVLVLARRVDRCVRSLMVLIEDLDQSPARQPVASEADRILELVARPLDAKRDAETMAVCIRERSRLERIEKHACEPPTIGCHF
ncbi:MAG: hypothetical protein ACKV2T_41050 [Kofleriaceae bacterium]